MNAEKLYHITNGYVFKRNDFTITKVDVVSQTPKSFKVNCHDRKYVYRYQLNTNLSVNGLDMFTTNLEEAFQIIYDLYKKKYEVAKYGYKISEQNLADWEKTMEKYQREEHVCFNLEK